ncbi:MAG: DUF6894 family protein [Sphingobacteriales bacterium]
MQLSTHYRMCRALPRILTTEVGQWEDVMPRFYFHLCHCKECIRDDVGCDLPDVATARIKAEKLARAGGYRLYRRVGRLRG